MRVMLTELLIVLGRGEKEVLVNCKWRKNYGWDISGQFEVITEAQRRRATTACQMLRSAAANLDSLIMQRRVQRGLRKRGLIPKVTVMDESHRIKRRS